MYPLIIVGATFYGCGLAARHPGSLLLESSVLAGSDFALTFDTGRDWDAPLVTPEAMEFRDELLNRHALMPDGRAATAAFSPVLSAWCIRHAVQPSFNCSPVAIQNKRVIATTPEGPQVLDAEIVVDTRPKPTRGQWLTALIQAPPATQAGGHGPFVLHNTLVEGEYTLSFQIPEDASWSMARAMFHRAWDMRPQGLRWATILLLATRFACHQFPNPAAALDAGLQNQPLTEA